MRILYCSHEGDGAWGVAVLAKAGHSVDWFIDKEKYADALKGIVPPPLTEIPDPDKYDLVIFDDTSNGELADAMREETPVIGSSVIAESLEDDRLAGIEFMEDCGINVPPYEVFDSVPKAIKWLQKTNARCVFKPSGHIEDKATTYVAKSAEDMADYLDKLTSKVKVKEFILQEFVEGTEVSTNAWFNGEDFYALDHSLEEKKFMSGGLGPNTGCSGVTYWMPSKPTRLFKEGLGLAQSQLASIGFVGPIDLNTIVTEDGIYGLEWTPRFGYEGICLQAKLINMDLGEFLYMIATGGTPKIEPAFAFAASIRVSVPPYPNPAKRDKYEGIPVKGIDLDQIENFYLSDVQIIDDEMVTLGTDGLIGAPIGCGETIKEAFYEVMKLIKPLEIPNLQYRNDIERCCEKRYSTLEKWGWLKI